MLSIWRRGHQFWQAPHRPLFLFAGVAAGLVPIVWLLPDGLVPQPGEWHRHELMFGAGGAAVGGGYLLTALPAWTGDDPVSPATTRLLVALWLLGRLAYSSAGPSVIGSCVAAIYFLALGSVLTLRVLKASAWSKMPLASAPFVLGVVEIATTPEYGSSAALVRALPLFFALLISLVGGRAVPAFTRHWLHGRGSDPSKTDSWMSAVAVAALAVAICCQVAETPTAFASLLIVSGVLQSARMVFWPSWKSHRYPALMLLHLAWFWLPTGLLMVGLSLLTSSMLDTVAAFHALTMGAMGAMMFAIMARAAMARSNGLLLVSRGFALGFVLVFVSVVIRLSVPLAGPNGPIALLLSVTFWSSGWATFVWNFGRAITGDVSRPILSARFPEPGGSA